MPLILPQAPNQRWPLEFASDMLNDGRRFCILVKVYDFTHECPYLVADTSLLGERVARKLNAVIAKRSGPAICVSNNGTTLYLAAFGIRPSALPGRLYCIFCT